MKQIVESLEKVSEINGLINDLKVCLELFDKGEKKGALEKLEESEQGIQDLLVELPEKGLLPQNGDSVERNLGAALSQLNWISENVDEYDI